MAWFSSGFSNLKEQLNSLINNDDSIGNDSRSFTDAISADIDSKGETLPQNLRNYTETSEQGEKSCQNRFSFVQRRRILQYSKMLNDLKNDVNILNTSLDQVLGDVVKCLDENERLREINIRKDGDGRHADVLLDKLKTDNVAAVKQDDDFRDNIECGLKTTDKMCDPLTMDASLTNEATKTSAVGDDSEITKKIENLMIEIDEINEKLNQSEKSWRKTTDDGRSYITVQTNMLADYTTLTHQRDVLWEKLKVSFIWPTIAKFKNAKISELSVPDSVKEVFQPASVLRSKDKTARQIVQNEAPADQILEERESTIVAHPPPSPTPPLGSENDRTSTATIAAQRVEQFIDTESNESPSTTDASIVEINRLRNHLVSVEQAYTNELLQCEEEIKILQNELKTKEEKLNSIAASYTATNLSSNKALERLQLEVQQLSNDNQQLTTQLHRCRNDLEESHVDTRNLRSALDFFRKNKDSEVYQATEKLKSEIRVLQSDNERLRENLASSQNDLDNSQQIFKKNEILNEELKKKLDEIDALQLKVDELLRQRFQNTNPSGEGGERTFKMEMINSTNTLDVEAKMRLNLIKNVAFRYLTSDSSTTKSQSLRILADVLEFSDGEKMKIGVSVRPSEKTNNNQSLIDEFIRFVEKESHPPTIQAEARQLMHKKIRDAASSSNLSSANAIASTTTSMNLPAHSLTSSSILLKDVLNSKDI